MFVFQLRDAESHNEAGNFITSVPGPWNIGNEFITGDGRRLRIVDQLADDPTADPRCTGVWLVESAEPADELGLSD